MFGWLKRLFRKEPEYRLKICGGMPTRKGHKEPKRHVTPSRHECRITKRKVRVGKRRKKEFTLKRAQENSSEREHLEIKWRQVIRMLDMNGRVMVTRHSHFGSLRGIDILLNAKRDLKRLGINVSIKKDDDVSIISLV